ncbi:MAG TPA: hypothetical protein ACFYD1_09490, partial [Candidatus Hypogeohydataceae bacterium YC38]|nr:hypothetical protein [Candidatus Brocadiales bacterium]
DGTVEWQKTYGWLNDDWVNSIQQTRDGGYIVVGTMAKIKWEFHTQGGVLVLKLRGDGTVEWQKNYRGGYGEAAYVIQQTDDNGYILAGGMMPAGVKETDLWVMKLKADGSLEWQRTYGGSGCDMARSIQQTSDGGYIVAGDTQSFNERDADLWVLKLRPDGSIGPSCRFIRSTNLFVEDGSALAGDTRVIPEESDITPQDSSVTVQDTGVSARFLVK